MPEEKGPGEANQAPGSLRESPSPGRFSRRALLGFSLAAVLALAGGILWAVNRGGGPTEESPPDTPRPPKAANRPAPPDPRLLYKGPFRNVHPGVKFVGDAACARCHEEKCESYRRHPMGRSMTSIDRLAARQPYDEKHNNPFDAVGYRFRVVREGDRVWHRGSRLDGQGRPVYELSLPVQYAVGSGTRGFSYLTSRDGFLFQTPITWYSQKGKWGKSPGFTQETVPGRPIIQDCLFCHANRVEFAEDYVNRSREPVRGGLAIGCERCHGPGELHVQTRLREPKPEGPVDYTIVNPQKLAYHLRQAVCEQCHLSGAARVVRRGRNLLDFRPGLPLEDFVAIFVRARRPDEEFKVVNHVEQMYRSRCFRESSGKAKLKCVSCHDPHRQVTGGEDRVAAHFRTRCLSCHQKHGCSEAPAVRQEKKDSCIACHMPRYSASDVSHAAMTDHRLLRRPEDTGKAHKDDGELINFYQAWLDPRDPEAGRDLALALIQVGLESENGAYAAANLRRALGLLEQSLARDPDDFDAWEAKGAALLAFQRPREALAAFESVLEQAPRRERSLAGAATAARELGRLEPAVGYWRRAVQVNPWVAQYRGNLALLLEVKEDWEEAGRQCRAWLDLDPGNVQARELRVRLLLHEGRQAEAQKEKARIKSLATP